MNTSDALKTENPPLGVVALTDLLGDSFCLLSSALFGLPSHSEQPPSVSCQLARSGDVLESWTDAKVTYGREAIPDGSGIGSDGIEYERFRPGDPFVELSFGQSVCKLKCHSIGVDVGCERLGG